MPAPQRKIYARKTSVSSPSTVSFERFVAAAALTGVAAVATKYIDSKYFLMKDAATLARLAGLGIDIQRRLYQNFTAADMLEEAAGKFGNKAALISESEKLSFLQWNARANQVARWALAAGNRKHDAVAIYASNSAEYMCLWIGLAKVGARAALINCQLKQDPLVHCVKVAHAKHLLFDADGAERVCAVRDRLPDVANHQFGEKPTLASCAYADFDAFDDGNVSRALRNGIGFGDPCMFIYTSGTTGLPKAAVVKHGKFYGAGAAFCIQFSVSGTDTIFNSGLPLYHSAGNNIGGGMCLYSGATLVIRKKFSATNFWRDVSSNRCTVIQYIGELCRFLLNTPRAEAEGQHRVRIAIGNGLRPEIWDRFQGRFQIPQIGEFYGSSEGNVALFNLCKDARARGAVGHMGALMRQLGLCRILKYDKVKEDVVRDPDTGFCVEADVGEPGEAIGELKDRAAGSFDGYLGNKQATEKKILRNVFKKGDAYFRTGDLLMLDDLGYYYFVDRIGDTFRWKGKRSHDRSCVCAGGSRGGAGN